MKITAVEPIHLRVPVVEAIPDGTLDVLVVRIHTDAGLTGIGEVTSQSYVCKACFEAPRSAARRHGLTSILLGEDPLDPVRLWEKMYYETNRYGRRGAAIHAISGADIALWDIKGKAEGKPVYELLGGPYRTTVRAYASVLFGETPEATAALAREFVDLGLTAAKFGWGPFGKDPDVDLAHVQAARDVLGDERDLMVDAGHAWARRHGHPASGTARAAEDRLAGRAAFARRPQGLLGIVSAVACADRRGRRRRDALGLRRSDRTRRSCYSARRGILRRPHRLPTRREDVPKARTPRRAALFQHRHQSNCVSALDGIPTRRRSGGILPAALAADAKTRQKSAAFS